MKRELAGIRERLTSATDQLTKLADDSERFGDAHTAGAVRAVIERDLAEAEKLLDYVVSIS